MFKQNEKKLILSALPYVNNQPHLGNIIGCVLSSDVYSRYCRKRGQKTLHICGTDEYGTAIEMAAINENTHPKDICEKNFKIHKQIYDWFGIYFDNFGRTTTPSHATNTLDIFKKMNDFIEIRNNEQLYCENCKIFLADRYVMGTCSTCKSTSKGDQCDFCGTVSTTLEDPKCSICETTPFYKDTKHVYLCLNKLQDEISRWAQSNWDSWSNNAREITREWIKKELHPRCITRDLKYKWGVPVPLPGFEEKVFYVWFDAPIGYISFTKDCDESFLKDSKIIQFMGKDNVSFHSIFFPGMCLASKTDFLPATISATEYLMFENQKFSKSKNIGIFGCDLIDGRYGNSSIWRYYLLKIRPETKDTNFRFHDFHQAVVSDLINNFGNFINRVLKSISKKGKISYTAENENSERIKVKNEFISKANSIYLDYLNTMESIGLRHGLQLVMEMSSHGNEYIQSGVTDKDKNVFPVGAGLIVLLGHMIDPFMPEIAEKIFKLINIEKGNYPDSFVLLEEGHEISKEICPLFSHFNEEQLRIMGLEK